MMIISNWLHQGFWHAQTYSSLKTYPFVSILGWRQTLNQETESGSNERPLPRTHTIRGSQGDEKLGMSYPTCQEWHF